MGFDPLLWMTAAALLSSTAGLAGEAQQRPAFHNGSRMLVQTQPPSPNGLARFVILYDQPSPYMAPLVHPGELLVDGTANMNDASVIANARVFVAGCPQSFPYRVTGRFDEKGMYLDGAAPVVYPFP
jgi:hypothetical protein